MNIGKRNNDSKKVPFAGVGLIFGTAIGAGLSIILTGDTVIWAGVGTGVGLIIGAIVSGTACRY